MYVGRYELSVPTSGTRDRRLRGYLVSFARCPRVETDLGAASVQQHPNHCLFVTLDLATLRLIQVHESAQGGKLVACHRSETGHVVVTLQVAVLRQPVRG